MSLTSKGMMKHINIYVCFCGVMNVYINSKNKQEKKKKRVFNKNKYIGFLPLSTTILENMKMIKHKKRK